jgi:hypothetical protein
VVGGLDKAGSTTIFHGLRQHPDVTVAYEPHRSGPWRPGAVAARSGVLLDRHNRFLYDEQAHQALETSDREGMASHVVVSLRDPVARAVSMYRHRYALGRLPTRMDVDAFVRIQLESRPPARNDDYLVVERGRYVTYLAALWERFGIDRVDVLVMEEWRDDPHGAICAVAERAGLDPAALPPLEREQVNPSGVQRHPSVMRAAHLLGRRSLRPVRGTRYEERHRERVDRATRWIYRRTVDVTGAPAQLSSEVETELRSYYAASVTELEAALGRPLPWGAQR